VGALVGRRLCRGDDAHQSGKALLMGAPPLQQREGLVAVRLRAEKRTDLLEAVTKAHGGGAGGEKGLWNSYPLLSLCQAPYAKGPYQTPLLPPTRVAVRRS